MDLAYAKRRDREDLLNRSIRIGRTAVWRALGIVVCRGAVTALAQAQVYRCNCAPGQTYLSDRPCPGQAGTFRQLGNAARRKRTDLSAGEQADRQRIEASCRDRCS